MTKSITTVELVRLMDNMWSTVKDIQRIGCVGKNNAYKIRDKIRRQMMADGQYVPRYVVSTQYVIEYFNIDEKKIRKNLYMEKGIVTDE